MSTMIMSVCWPLQHMSPVQKSVLISLADNANDQGVCWPSIATISKRTCVSERAVQNAIKWLEQHGLLTANRANGRHTSYTVTPASYAPPHRMHPRTKCTGAGDAPTPAADAGDPRRICVAPPHQMPTNRKEPSEEPSLNRQPARRAPRVALHGQILNLDLPDWLPFESWDAWCEHREAKAKDAPWTMAAAKVSIKRLGKLLDAGQPVETTIDEAVLRGWTGLFPVKADAPTSAAPGAQSIAADWWKTSSGIDARAAQLGVKLKDGETFMHFKVRVFKAAGPGEWMEDMLRTVGRESEERYEQLYAYFNDIPRDKNGNTEAA
ncbi:helix-turn-helix protein [Paraburkholderia tropica]|uniref:Helix-turn-helix protein n=1 Tax=Paraburkholderia tropica TaxID=92647 RepID=A0ABX5MLF6_9BURK|nr:helix-turn-helix domain-containing protein [Paraburkholderia tropica]PXX14492.1 helix-turn-helix protein [Paraburkholderia tropica]PZW79557.1 helix-turn-helix protein [Paraburkholderia tropica]